MKIPGDFRKADLWPCSDSHRDSNLFEILFGVLTLTLSSRSLDTYLNSLLQKAAVKRVNIKITSWNYSKLFLREPQTLLNWTFWLCFNLSHSWGQDQLLYRHWRHQLTCVKVTRLHYLIKDLLVRKLKSWLFDRWRTGSRIRVQTENSCECCRFRLTCSFSISVLAACFAFPMAHPQ